MPNESTDKLIMQICNELDYMVAVPAKNQSMRCEQAELSIRRENIKKLLAEVAENEIYILARLKHSETERFKDK